jgi:hypothetical protein
MKEQKGLAPAVILVVDPRPVYIREVPTRGHCFLSESLPRSQPERQHPDESAKRLHHTSYLGLLQPAN